MSIEKDAVDFAKGRPEIELAFLAGAKNHALRAKELLSDRIVKEEHFGPFKNTETLKHLKYLAMDMEDLL